MPYFRHLFAFAVALAFVPAACAEEIDLRRHWDIATATQRNTAFRKKICLNGFWQFSPLAEAGSEPAGQWQYLKVPGGTRMQFYVHDAEVKADQEATLAMETAPFGLYRRTFELDRTDAGKKVCLNIYYAWYSATIYVNGRQIKTIIPAKSIVDRRVDITDAVQVGTNEVRILVNNEPPKSVKKNRQAGLCDDVWLEIDPAGPRIEQVRVVTSVQEKTLTLTVRLAETAGHKLTLAGKLMEHITAMGKTGPKALDLPARGLAPDERGVASVTYDLAPYWSKLRLWNFEDPALYELVLDLTADGTAADQVVERIGLRETKIVGHEFFLNGRKAHVRDCYKFLEKFSRGRYAGFADPRVFRRRVRLYKQAGWNLCHSFSAYEPYLDTILDVMDEEGLMFYPLIIAPSGYKSVKRDPDMFRMVTEAIEHYGNHPSIVLWSMFTTGGFGTEESIRNPWAWTLKKGPMYPNKRSKQLQAGHDAFFDHIKSVDPSRPVLFGSLTNFGQGITGFYYPNFGMPTQEIASWPIKWYNTPDRKANWMLESTFRYLGSWGNQRQHKRKGIWEEQVYENAARSLGPAAYPPSANVDPSPNVKPYIKQAQPGDTVAGEVISHTGQNPVFMDRMNEHVRQIVRAWRAYDVACMGLGDEFHLMFDVYRSFGNTATPVHAKYRVPLDQLKTPGPKADWHMAYERLVNIEEPELGELSPRSAIFDSMQQQAVGPFLAMLGHKGARKGQFTWPDHAYYAGDRIDKQVILINDHAEPRNVSYRVTLDGRMILKRSLRMDSGQIEFVPFSFRAPTTTGRSEHVLALTAQIAPGRLASLRNNVAAEIVKGYPSTLTDSLALQVFGRVGPRIESGGLKIALYDETGRTTDLMKRTGLRYRKLAAGADLTGVNLIVVGRDSFTDRFRQLAAELDLDARIASGQCDMLIFEQNRESCAFDRELRNAAARHAFIVDRTHPAVAGLSDADFSNWRGETDLQESAPPVYGYMKPGTPYFPKWTNEGQVSSFPILKPEYGNFRVIVDCWFDLNYAALLEVFSGRGSVMFCQLDVTNDRFGTDPAATQVVRNLLAYYAGRASQPKVDPFGPVYRLAGDEVAQRVLTARGVEARTFSQQSKDGTLVIAAKVADADAVKSFVAAGGKVIYLSAPEAGIDSELVGGAVTATEVANVVYQLPARPDVLLRGVSQAELHFKGSPTALSLDGPDPLVEGGVIAKARHGEGFFLIVPWLDPAAATGPNMLRAPKIERLYSTLLTNLGVRQGGISLFDGPGQPAEGEVLAKFDFESDDVGPFWNCEVSAEQAAVGKGSLKAKPFQKTWCVAGIGGKRIDEGPEVTGESYLSFYCYATEPTWLQVSVSTGSEMAKRVRLSGGKWTPVSLRLDRFEGYPPAGLAGAKVRQVEFYAGDPGREGLEFYVDEVTFSTGPLADFDGRAYVPMFERSPYHHWYDADSYYRW